MAERSLRTRITDSSGRSYAEAISWGARWESLRSRWFNACGMNAEASDAMARMHRFKQEYQFETGKHLHHFEP